MNRKGGRRRFAAAVTRVTGYEVRRARPEAAPPPKSEPAPQPAPRAAEQPAEQLAQQPAKPAKGRVEKAPTPVDAEELAERIARVGPHDRLVPSPAFVMSSVRSGSTLLRMMLNTHSQICSPHELHLRRIKAVTKSRFALMAIEELGMDERDLTYLLWDRIFHRELQRSGKRVLVNKTPNDALIWPDIVSCWPQAQMIYLHRHPAAILNSSDASRGDLTREESARDVLAYCTGMEQLRAVRPGLIVRYEDLVADPERETRRICEFLDVPWEAGMVDYASGEHVGIRRGLGDWSETLRSGKIRARQDAPAEEDLHELLRPIAQAWGYL